MDSIKKAIPIVIIFLYGAAGLVTALAFAEFMVKEPDTQPDFTTRFYVINESKEIIFGKPVSYRTIIENQEGTKVNYDLKVRSAGEVVYIQEISLDSNQGLNQTVSFIPNLTSDYQKLEFLLYRNNELYRTRVFQVSQANHDLKYISAIENYSVQSIDGIVVYTFNTGEKLELKATNEIVGKDDAIYTSANKGNNIIFLGETYEKSLPNSAKFLNPIIMQDFNITLKINENLKLENDYLVTLIHIDENAMRFRISKGNKILRDIASIDKSPVEYWIEINEFRKEKMIRIIPKEINSNMVMFDIIQYGRNKVINIENKYGEFQITQITEDAIIMKNIQEIKIEPGKDILLINDTIRIKV